MCLRVTAVRFCEEGDLLLVEAINDVATFGLVQDGTRVDLQKVHFVHFREAIIKQLIDDKPNKKGLFY
jgi:hypothetical protein